MLKRFVFKVHPGEKDVAEAFRKSARFLRGEHILETGENLITGDIRIEDPEGRPRVIIERKWKNDAKNSLPDARYIEQKARMNLNLDENCLQGFVIEKAKIDDELLHMVTSIVIKHRYFCFFTNTPEQTALVALDILEKSYKVADKSTEMNEILGGQGKITKGGLREKHFFTNLLRGVPQVSAERALAIKKTYPTLRAHTEAWNRSEQPHALLKDIMIGKKRLGNAVSEKIYRCIWGEELAVVIDLENKSDKSFELGKDEMELSVSIEL